MSQEDGDKTLSLYFSAIECYEEVENLFNENNIGLIRISSVLQKCVHSIESIILGEDNDCAFLVDLFQLKQHALELTKFVEKEQINFIQRKYIQKPYESELNTTTNKEKEELRKTIEATIDTPRVKGLEEIAGLWEVKKSLRNKIILPRSQPQLFANRQILNSILLFGPPGTGKTQLVHALTYDAGALLFSVSAGNILSSFVGQSEKSIKFLFDYIKNKETCSILFIDEVDGFCRKRSDSEQECSRRIKTELLCQMTKMERNSNFFLIAATNCPWDLDPAFLRRFHERIYIPLPTYSERRDLFRVFTKNTPLENNISSWELIIDKTEGFSGSDIHELVNQALEYPILDLEDTKIWKNCSDGFYEPITQADDFNLEEITCSDLKDLPPCSVRARDVGPVDLIKAFDNVNVTITKEDIQKYEQFVKQ